MDKMQKTSPLINIETYDAETGVIASKASGDKCLMGRVYVMSPLAGGGTEVKTVISNFFKTATDDTIIQVNELAFPDYEAEEFILRGKEHGSDVVQSLYKMRSSVLTDALVPGWAEQPILSKKLVVITCAVPVSDMKARTFDDQAFFQDQFLDQLISSGFHDARWLEISEVVSHYRLCFNLYQRQKPVELDPDLEVKYQVLGPDEKINPKNFCVNDSVYIQCVSVKSFPKRGEYGLMTCVSGAPFNESNVKKGGGNRIEVPFMISTTVRVANQIREKKRVEDAIKSREQKNTLPFSLDNEKPEDKLKDLELFRAQLMIDGNKAVEVSVNIFTYGQTKDQAVIQASRIKSQMDGLGYDARLISSNQVVRFFQTLPMNFSPKIANKIEGEALMTVKAVAPHLPIISDFTGYPSRLNAISAGVVYMTRRGSLYAFDPFVTMTNPNGIIVADSGGGKSFALQDMVLCFLAMGEKTIVVDDGNSFKKFAIAAGAEFNEFSYSSPFKPNLNPYAGLNNDQFNEQSETITSLLLLMAYPDGNPQSGADIALSEASRSAYGQKGEETQITDVIDALESITLNAEVSSARSNTEVFLAASNLISRLKSFLENPKRGMFFKGEGTIDPKAQFTVFELSGLGDDKHFKKVVVFYLLNMLVGRLPKYKGKKHLLVDEALTFIQDENAVKALDGIYQKSRKDKISCFLVIQSLKRLAQVPNGETIINLSNWKIFLAMPSDEAEALITGSYLGDMKEDEYFKRLLKDVQIVKGFYSELLISGNRGYEVVRLYGHPFVSDIFTSEGDARDAVLELIDQGWHPLDAVRKVRGDSITTTEKFLSNVIEELKREGLTPYQMVKKFRELAGV